MGSNCTITYAENVVTGQIEIIKIHKMTELEHQNKLTEYGLNP